MIKGPLYKIQQHAQYYKRQATNETKPNNPFLNDYGRDKDNFTISPVDCSNLKN